MPFDTTTPATGALVYTGAGGLFTELCKGIGACNSLKYIGRKNLAQIKEDVQTILEPGRLDIWDGQAAAFDLFDANIMTLRKSIVKLITDRLLDEPTVVYQLGLDTADIDRVLARLREKMVADAKTVL